MDTSYYRPTLGGSQWVMKFTGLAMDSFTANGAQLCITLNSECPTLQASLNNPLVYFDQKKLILSSLLLGLF